MDPLSTNTVSPPELPESESPKRKRYLKPTTMVLALVFIAVIIILNAVVIFVYSKTWNNSPTPQLSQQKSLSPTLTKDTVPTYISSQSDSFMLDGIKLPFNSEQKLIPLGKNKNIFYMKSGNIWMANTANVNKITKRLIYSAKNKILDFTISNDEKYLAYTYRKLEYPPMDGANKGDTVVLVDLIKQTESEIYSENLENDQLNGIIFSPDDKNIYYTNTKIHVYNMDSKLNLVYTSSTKPYSISCSYNPTSFSPNGQFLLLSFHCWEGGKQIVFDTQSATTIGEFNNGYIGGGTSVLGFLSDNTLLGFNNLAPLLRPSQPEYDFDYEKQELKLGIYSTNGALIKTLNHHKLTKLYILNVYFENNLSDAKTYLALPENGESNNYNVYEIDAEKNIVRKSTLKNDFILTQMVNPGDSASKQIHFYNKTAGAMYEIDRLVDLQPVIPR